MFCVVGFVGTWVSLGCIGLSSFGGFQCVDVLAGFAVVVMMMFLCG